MGLGEAQLCDACYNDRASALTGTALLPLDDPLASRGGGERCGIDLVSHGGSGSWGPVRRSSCGTAGDDE